MKNSIKKIFNLLHERSKQYNITNILLFFLLIASLIAVILTYAFFTRIFPANAGEHYIISLLNIDLILLISVSVLMIKKILSLWFERKKNGFGNRLHLKMIIIFTVVAAVPTMLVAVFSATFFTIGMQSWFSSQVASAVRDSLNVAESYAKERREELVRDIVSINSDFIKNRDILKRNPKLISPLLEIKVNERDLDEAVVFNNKGKVIAKSGFTFSLTFEEIPFWALNEAKLNDIAILTDSTSNRMRALIKIRTKEDWYLLIGKITSPEILKHIRRAKLAVARYNALEEKRINIEITFYSMFIAVALLLILSSTLSGITFSFNFTKSLNSLIDAAEQIRMGKIGVKVRELEGNDEISTLNRTFNRMSQDIATQRNDLIASNNELDKRRRFIETVLKGVSAGVISVDEKNNIRFANISACTLLDINLNEHKGENLNTIVPDFASVFDNFKIGNSTENRHYIKLHSETMYKNLTVNIVGEYSDDNKIYGYIYTFDDITPLETAQRKAAWSDVARKIAHEIKNPLTPIILSAEQLKTKYKSQIKDKQDIFENCVETIINQVENIGKMVDEFSAFSRMPLPVMKEVNIKNIIRQSIILQKNANPNIKYSLNLPAGMVNLCCDESQVTHLLTNLLKNSAEAITEKNDTEKNENTNNNEIGLSLENNDDSVTLTVQDNGIGLKNQTFAQISEPYYTTKEKGTGLGLAIVKKIIEDHNGTFNMKTENGKTSAIIVLPKNFKH